MLDSLMNFLTWLSQHPWLAYTVVFIVALLESFVLVGFFMPGVVILFMFGALIGSGHLPWSIVWAVMAGAISGDAISYWLGHHYRQHLQVMWPFNRYPKLFAMGTNYFYKHGGKSVFFGRFVGLIRPIIAVIAGMLSMPVWQFMIINILSAVLWSVLYLVPGVIFSASLSLAAEVAGRLVVLLISLVASIWLLSWLTIRLFRIFQPLGHWLVMRLDDWRLNHEYGHRLLYPVFDPLHGRVHEHLFVILSLFGGFIVWGLLLYAVLPDGGDAVMNHATYQMLQSLHTPHSYNLLVLFTQLGSLTTILPFYVMLGFWFYRRGYINHVILLGVLIMMGEGLVMVLKEVTDVTRPFTIEGIQAGAFPSGHVLMSTLFYGALSIIIASRLPPYRRWIPYLILILLLFTMVFSRLYLGAHWASDVIAALLIAIPLLIISGIVVYRLPAENGRLLWLPTLAVAVLLILVQMFWRFETELQRYQKPPAEAQLLSVDEWLTSRWQELPLYRNDLLEGHKPFNLQWQGNAGAIHAYLSLQGWQAIQRQSYEKILQWFNANAGLTQLMIPNHIHGSDYQHLLFIRPDDDPQRWQVIRLWQSPWQTKDGSAFWVGNINYLEIRSRIGIRYLATVDEYQTSIELLGIEQPLHCRHTLNHTIPMLLCNFPPNSPRQ